MSPLMPWYPMWMVQMACSWPSKSLKEDVKWRMPEASFCGFTLVKKTSPSLQPNSIAKADTLSRPRVRMILFDPLSNTLNNTPFAQTKHSLWYMIFDFAILWPTNRMARKNLLFRQVNVRNNNRCSEKCYGHCGTSQDHPARMIHRDPGNKRKTGTRDTSIDLYPQMNVAELVERNPTKRSLNSKVSCGTSWEALLSNTRLQLRCTGHNTSHIQMPPPPFSP